jgi:hypothetical protein
MLCGLLLDESPKTCKHLLSARVSELAWWSEEAWQRPVHIHTPI